MTRFIFRDTATSREIAVDFDEFPKIEVKRADVIIRPHRYEENTFIVEAADLNYSALDYCRTAQHGFHPYLFIRMAYAKANRGES